MEIVKKSEVVEVKGKKIKVELSYYYDKENDLLYDDVELGNENLRTIRNTYRKENGLLTDTEIKSIRTKYNLNQRNFSLLLGFGEITITRYESKSIQEKAHDIIIRNANDPELFLNNVIDNKDLYLKYNSEDSYNNLIMLIKSKINKDLFNSGNIEYDEEKFFAVINHLVKNDDKLTKTKLAKYLWYIDFSSYKLYGKSMMGLTYVHNHYGAYPIGYNDKLSNDNVEIIEKYYEDNDNYVYFINGCKSTIELEEDEKKIVDLVLEKFKNYNTKQFVDYMHKEYAYKETKPNEIIKYEYADKLSII